jgi:ribose 1,5-bisphosphate isomerase
MLSTTRQLKEFKRDLLDLNIQGATAVAKATLNALAEYLANTELPTTTRGWKDLEKLGENLAGLRPTEPLARNIMRWYLVELKSRFTKSSFTKFNWLKLIKSIQNNINYHLTEAESVISKHGLRLVKNRQVIFTHCHSSLAENILLAARRQGKRFQVYHTETRPLFQGRITDEHLRRAGITSTMVVDSAAAYLVSNHSGDEVKVAWVLLGADSLARDGSVINKIGSFGIALAAYDSKVPVYIASSLLKLDWHRETKIELRSSQEVWPQAKHSAKIINYAFDKIPAKYIKGIICEFGVVKPNQVTALVRRHYPWLFRSAKTN